MELLIANIQKKKLAFNLENIQEVIEKGTVEPLPNSPKSLEGIFNYRKRVIPIFNLREIMGIKSFHNEQCELLDNAKAYHKQWVENFKLAIESDGELSIEIDESKCELGKWISENLRCMKCNNKGYVNLIKSHLLEPHNQLHQLVKDYKSTPTPKIMKDLEKLFKENLAALDFLKSNITLLTNAFQKVIIYKMSERVFGISIDDIDRIINVSSSELKDAEVAIESNFIKGNKVIELEKKITLILEFQDKILESFDSFKQERRSA